MDSHRNAPLASALRQRVAWLALVFSFLISATACQRTPLDINGPWRGTVKNPSGEEIAFTLELKKEGEQITGALVNGDERVTASSGSFDGKMLKLRFDFYDAELTATLDEAGVMKGEFVRQYRRQMLKRPLQATRNAANESASNTPSGDVSGEWILRVGEAPKQSLWRAAFSQQGADVRGTIIPMSGDWGQMSGTVENGELKLYRFDGINARVLKVKLTGQGSLEGMVDLGLFDPQRKVVAERLTAQNKDLVASLPNPVTYTRMSNPAEPFRFSFPDLEGKTVSATDDRFKNKVVVVSLTGSWCPNCYDEGPLLQEFYSRYRAQGLEVVALAFEYTGEAARDIEQVKIFARKLGLQYPVLYAGATDETEKKLPQLVNFGAYPTMIFIGRDGLVKRIHAGFEGKATGERYLTLKTDLENLLKELLAEDTP